MQLYKTNYKEGDKNMSNKRNTTSINYPQIRK